MITDLIQIRRLGEQKRPENERFRRHIKTHDFPERKFRRIAEAIEDEIDCMQCAECCRVAAIVPLQERDVEKLARFLRISPERFIAGYTQQHPDEGMILRHTQGEPCMFLSGNECTVYAARPSICVSFPHLVRGAGSIAHRMWQFIDRACYCPIVYNSLEAYKDEVGFRRG
jgi:uncharacterized protein